MRDLNVLKERIDYAERHLKASHTARERESEALMAMWRQIRDRFEGQEQEISRYRQELSDLTRVNDELSALVDRLIGSIEGSVAETAVETVPTIANLAGELLNSEPGSIPNRAPRPKPAARAPEPAPVAVSEPEPEQEAALPPLDLPAPAPEASFEDTLRKELAADIDEPEISPAPAQEITDDSASEGIRDLISRIEGAVSGAVSGETPSKDADEEDPQLTKELEDIEALRAELNGLRNKISSGA